MESEWGITNSPSWGRSGLTYEQMQETWTANKTIETIKQFSKKDKPFLVFTSFKGPHWDYMVPEPYDTMYDPRSIEKWGNFFWQTLLMGIGLTRGTSFETLS